MAKVKCNNCGERVAEEQTDMAMRKTGGSYNRAGNTQQCRICAECCERLLARQTHGHLSVSRWSISSLARAQQRMRERAAQAPQA